MTRDDIIRMAQEAGLTGLVEADVIGNFERFAALVATTEKQKVVEYMNSRAFATGHGDTTEDLLKELEWQIKERERKACALIADEEFGSTLMIGDAQPKHSSAWRIAAAIRARGET